MVELFPAGWEELERDDGIELAAYAGPEDGERLREVLGPVAQAGIAADWRERWRAFHRPVRIGPLWVGPPWELPPTGELPVVIDPGQAFGTGGHATTRLCLELLVDLEPVSVADLGSGSGVLAIAAAKLGFAPAVALDHDEAAVRECRANAVANGVAVEALRSDLVVDALPQAELALANLELRLVEMVAARFGGRLLIASGYLATEAPEAPGWLLLDRREVDGWAAELFERAG